MSDMAIQQVLAEARALAARASGTGAAPAANAQGADFTSLLKQSLEEVNAAQKQAGDLTTRFSMGDPGVSLPEVMVAVQKAGLGMEAVTQVRNRLIAAYQEIMNMQV